ncbi:MAG TPA: hypothetical protein DCM28_08040 [Phycisphaerales bacterium]|nr:hypothetical protein [Phycisphaerales bacterium]HCD31189.1 hypothetical protein [Phycisphaerales bacterium]
MNFCKDITMIRLFSVLVVICLMINVDVLQAADEAPQKKPNLVRNGGFEEGDKYWGFAQWKGLALPGRFETFNAPEGKQYFVLTEPGTTERRFIRTNPFPVDSKHDYVFTVTLATENVRKGTINVRALQYGQKDGKKSPVLGWVAPNRPGVHDLIPSLAGTTDWTVYTFKIPGKSLNPKTTSLGIYFNHEQPSLGELKIDAVHASAE